MSLESSRPSTSSSRGQQPSGLGLLAEACSFIKPASSPSTDLPHQCDFDGCNKAYHFENSLNRHLLLVHSSKRIFHCSFVGCVDTFPNSELLKQHMLNMHNYEGDKSSQSIALPPHGLKFTDVVNEFDEHELINIDDSDEESSVSNESSSNKLFQCDQCEKSFQKVSCLVHHAQKNHSEAQDEVEVIDISDDSNDEAMFKPESIQNYDPNDLKNMDLGELNDDMMNEDEQIQETDDVKVTKMEDAGKKVETVQFPTISGHFTRGSIKRSLASSLSESQVEEESTTTSSTPYSAKKKTCKCDREGCRREFKSEKWLMNHIQKWHPDVEEGEEEEEEMEEEMEEEEREDYSDEDNKEFDPTPSRKSTKPRPSKHPKDNPDCCSMDPNEFKFKCTFDGCNQSFKYEGILKEHFKEAHPNSKLFHCSAPNCTKKYQTKYLLHNHIQKRHDKYKYECPMLDTGCGGRYGSRSDYRLHIEEHVANGDRPFRCNQPGCGEAFKKNHVLKQHIREVHPTENFTCTVNGCGRILKNQKTLLRHISLSHRPVWLKCEEPGCEKQYKTKQNLKRHFEIEHLNILPFHCTWLGCSRSFSRYSGLEMHLAAHLKPPVEYPENYRLACPYPNCTKRYEFESRLNDHILRHGEQRTCTAPSCNRTFHSELDLQRHIRKEHHAINHELEFVCPLFEHGLCEHKFGYRKDLHRHIEEDHVQKGEEPYKCRFCVKRFFTRSKQSMHERGVHKRPTIRTPTPRRRKRPREKVELTDEDEDEDSNLMEYLDDEEEEEEEVENEDEDSNLLDNQNEEEEDSKNVVNVNENSNESGKSPSQSPESPTYDHQEPEYPMEYDNTAKDTNVKDELMLEPSLLVNPGSATMTSNYVISNGPNGESVASSTHVFDLGVAIRQSTMELLSTSAEPLVPVDMPIDVAHNDVNESYRLTSLQANTYDQSNAAQFWLPSSADAYQKHAYQNLNDNGSNLYNSPNIELVTQNLIAPNNDQSICNIKSDFEDSLINQNLSKAQNGTPSKSSPPTTSLNPDDIDEQAELEKQKKLRMRMETIRLEHEILLMEANVRMLKAKRKSDLSEVDSLE